ncbi:serine threonine-protein kinase oca2 [Lichtheimia corymbifera JMRC:FSU:9682]|uniref:Serine threonine-protein kinase oca2 n=1 Tax=Lichtheimia corymbifera JMRC:FSU:9682 TaxID=1263082 RepID=A0A068RYH9_9FUNG|nr:serine threonine-protein kinase oca2 [Lichtheimia corymbifera JMRC:FSU:9682]
MHSLLLQHDIASPERSLPSSPHLSPAVVTHTSALHSSHGSNSSKDMSDLTRLLQKVGSSRSKHAYPAAVKPTSPPTSSTASSSTSTSSSSSFSQPSTAPSSAPHPRHSPVIPTPMPQQTHYQRPQLLHRSACSNLPAQFVFKKPEYNEEYQRTHFHHLATDSKDSFLGWSDLRRFFVSDNSSASLSSSDSSSHGRVLEADVIGNQFRHDIEGRYGRWGRYIGKGAGGCVRLIHRSADSKPVAVKQFRKQLPHESDKDYIKKVTAEFCIGSTLQHPNVIQTLDIIQDGPNFYEIMEYAPNDMFNIVMSGMMSREEIGCCWRQMLQGLEYLHSMGIAHRDLKLDNLVLDHQGILKIIDFGCSCVFKYPFEKTTVRSKGIYGSEPYIAPEQYTQTTYDPVKSDVWSCGIILFCMIIQRFPWQVPRMSNPAFRAFATNPTQQQFRILRMLPRETRSVMASLLELDPSRRPSVKAILNNDAWVKNIDVCTIDTPGAHHVHHVQEASSCTNERGNLVIMTSEPPGFVAEKERRKQRMRESVSPPSSPSTSRKSSPGSFTQLLKVA